MSPFTVIYVIDSEGIGWQFFECSADNDDHAEEQCMNAYPEASVLWGFNEVTRPEKLSTYGIVVDSML